MVKLLLVEDNPVDQELVRRGFRDLQALAEPVEVTVADSVDAALALLQRETFAVVLTDYSLPGRNGLELVRALRASGDSTPIIMLTGSADVMVAVTALQDGAADFVLKDVAFERALAVVVRRVIDKQAAALAHEQERHRLGEHVQQLERRLDAQTRELRRALLESEALRQVAEVLASANEMSTALDLVAKAAAQLLQAQAAAVVLQHGSELVLVSSWGPVKQTTGVKRADLPAVLAADWVSVATATMREDDEAIGLLWVGRACHGTFVPHETELLEALSDLTALSIAKLRAREQLRRLRDAQATASEGVPPADVDTAPRAADEPPLVPPPAPSACDADDHGVDPGAVLIVDDSERVLLQARAALQDTMTVLTATSGTLALETYAAERPAVVVVDLVMPGMDGVATLAELQKLGCSSAIALALRGDVAAHERARKAGYLAVIEKPFREGELAGQIMAALTASAGLGTDHFSEDDGYPVLTLPDRSSKILAKLIPLFDRHLRALAEDGTDRLILDAANLTEITPEHVAILVRLCSQAGILGIETVICTPDEQVVSKLRQIVEIRDTRYVATRTAAKHCLQ